MCVIISFKILFYSERYHIHWNRLRALLRVPRLAIGHLATSFCAHRTISFVLWNGAVCTGGSRSGHCVGEQHGDTKIIWWCNELRNDDRHSDVRFRGFLRLCQIRAGIEGQHNFEFTQRMVR